MFDTNATTVVGKGESFTMIGALGIAFLERRKLDPEIAVRFGVYTARHLKGTGLVPSESGNVLGFPFIEGGGVVNEKFRAVADKKFWHKPGGRCTFWNASVLDDPVLTNGTPLIVTEGIEDALTAIQCGFPHAVSVPHGAPPANSHSGDDDRQGKFEFVWHNRERLKSIKRFILAVDNDEPGKRLAEELERRFSAAKCLSVTYPEGCKDLNDVLVKHGPEMVAGVLNSAKPCPVRGLYKLSDYPDRGPLKTFRTGWKTLDELFQLYRGEFIVVTGIPSHGKSAWVLNLMANLAEIHGWRSAIFSQEMPTVPFLRNILRRIKSRKYDGDPRDDAWINEYFSFIGADATGDEQDDNLDLNWILERARDAVFRDGINALVIDPWNEIEHARPKHETTPDYIARSIRDLKRFARLYGVTVIVIAHPTKDVVGRDGKPRTPTLYDIDGAAHWFNKADHGVIVERPNSEANDAVIHVAKARFSEVGRRGSVKMRFDTHTSRFEMLADL